MVVPSWLWDPVRLFKVVTMGSDLFLMAFCIELLLIFFKCACINAGGTSDYHSNSRALLEHALASSAAANCNRGEFEHDLAAAAASSTSVPCKFTPDETKRNKRHLDAQDCMNELVGGMMSEASVIADAIESITRGNLVLPTKKRQSQIKSITENLAIIYQDKRMLIDMGLLTVDVDDQIKKLLQERSSI